MGDQDVMELELNMARDMMDRPLTKDCRDRLIALLDNPNEETWDKAFSILLNRSMTLWQAVVEVDPTFPKTGKRTDSQGRVIQGWPRIPDLKTLERALRFATH